MVYTSRRDLGYIAELAMNLETKQMRKITTMQLLLYYLNDLKA